MSNLHIMNTRWVGGGVVGGAKFSVDEGGEGVTVEFNSLNFLCRLSDRSVFAVCMSERLACNVIIWVLREACPSVTEEMIAVVCSSLTENDSLRVLREEVLVAFDVVTILWIRSSSESTLVNS